MPLITLNGYAVAVNPAKTVLLMNFENDLVDAATNKAITKIGTTGYSTGGASPNGTKCLIITTQTGRNGLQSAVSDDFNFGVGDFTIECWFANTQNTTIGQLCLIACANASSTTGIVLGYDPSKRNVFVRTPIANIFAPTKQTYGGGAAHAAYSRVNSVGYLFLNGTLVASGADARMYTDSICNIGLSGYGPGNWYGFIDQVRITKGKGRYTSNFSPSTSLTTDI